MPNLENAASKDRNSLPSGMNGRPISPMGVPRDAAGALLFGGTFDPIHRAHVVVATAARDALMGGGGWLVFVPAARSPHKAQRPMASDADRCAMLAAAIADVARCRVWTDEIDRGGPSYWAETAARAERLLGDGVVLRTLIGSDQALRFAAWSRPAEIERVAEPAVVLRPPHATVDEFGVAARSAGLDAGLWRSRVVPAPIMDVSATRVRELLAAGRYDDPALRASLEPAVLSYIRGRGLYC